MKSINVLLEIGKKKTFASAADWPGWSRGGRDEESALQTLVEYGSRYAQVVRHTQLNFHPPADISEFVVIERSKGSTATDFGVPEIIAEVESKPIDLTDLERLKAILMACWKAFDDAVQQATGKELRKGPRGGGRDLEKMLEHVMGAEQGYLRRLAWKSEKVQFRDREEEIKWTREAILKTLEKAAKEGLPEQGPRGGKIWPVRYYARRAAWHVLDHAWEVEDRILAW